MGLGVGFWLRGPTRGRKVYSAIAPSSRHEPPRGHYGPASPEQHRNVQGTHKCRGRAKGGHEARLLRRFIRHARVGLTPRRGGGGDVAYGRTLEGGEKHAAAPTGSDASRGVAGGKGRWFWTHRKQTRNDACARTPFGRVRRSHAHAMMLRRLAAGPRRGDRGTLHYFSCEAARRGVPK